MRSQFKYPLALLYFVVIVWLAIGTIAYRASSATTLLFYHALAYIVAFAVLIRSRLSAQILSWRFFGGVSKETSCLSLGFWRNAALAIFLFCFVTWLFLGGMPLAETLMTKNSIDAVRIRGLIAERSSPALNYATAIALSGILPVVCLFAFIFNAPYRKIILGLSLIFACSLLQKSYPLMIVFPSFMYFLMVRRYFIGLSIFFIGILGLLLVHVALLGYLYAGGLIKSAEAADSGASNKLSMQWFPLRLNHAVSAWEDGRVASISSGSINAERLKFDGRQAYYSPLPPDLTLGAANFKLAVNYLPRSSVKGGPYATIIYIGPSEARNGMLALLHRWSAETGDFIEVIINDKDGLNSFGLNSAPIGLGRFNEIVVARQGQTLEISVDGDSRRGNLGRIFDLVPNVGGEAIVQLGTQLAGPWRETWGQMRNAEIGDISLNRFSNTAGDPIEGLGGLDARIFINAKVISENIAGSSFTPKLNSGGGQGQFYVIGVNLADRIFRIPGRTGAIWMEFIPDILPFLHGCGYRVVAPLLGCTFRNYSEEIHALYEPDLHEIGIRGTMNVAEVFNSYANFGMFGGVISGIVMASLLYVISGLFSNQPKIGFAVSVGPVLLSSSTALLTQLLSGGWGIAIILSLYFCRWMPVGGDAVSD